MALELRTMRTLIAELEDSDSKVDKDYLYELIKTSESCTNIAIEMYKKSLHRIRTHRPIRKELDKFETLLWVFNSELDIKTLSWFQFGAPRLKAISEELEFLWPDDARLRNMVNGKPCEASCIGCTDYTTVPTYNWRRK